MPRDFKPKAELKEIPFLSSTIETVDRAMTEWLQNLNIHAESNKGFTGSVGCSREVFFS